MTSIYLTAGLLVLFAVLLIFVYWLGKIKQTKTEIENEMQNARNAHITEDKVARMPDTAVHNGLSEWRR